MTEPSDKHPHLRHCIGLDLGKQSDPSALALLRWVNAEPCLDERAYRQRPKPIQNPEYYVPTLKRWTLGTAYTDIVSDVVKFMNILPASEVKPILVVDGTGVGAAVCEMVKAEIGRAGVRGGMVSVTITSGHAVTCLGGGVWHVAKKQLASVMQVLLGNRRIYIEPRLPEAKTLQRELGTFSTKITSSANETYEAWREADHDDLVLAVALAAWAAESLDVWRVRPPRPAGLKV